MGLRFKVPMQLTSKQTAYLKSLAHDKKPVVLLGHKGVTEAVAKELGLALDTHELVKVRLNAEEKEELDQDALSLSRTSQSVLVERRGKVAIYYRRRKDNPTIVLPKDRPVKVAAKD